MFGFFGVKNSQESPVHSFSSHVRWSKPCPIPTISTLAFPPLRGAHALLFGVPTIVPKGLERLFKTHLWFMCLCRCKTHPEMRSHEITLGGPVGLRLPWYMQIGINHQHSQIHYYLMAYSNTKKLHTIWDIMSLASKKKVLQADPHPTCWEVWKASTNKSPCDPILLFPLWLSQRLSLEASFSLAWSPHRGEGDPHKLTICLHQKDINQKHCLDLWIKLLDLPYYLFSAIYYDDPASGWKIAFNHIS